MLHQVIFCITHIQIIQDKYAVAFQGRADGAYGAVMFPLRPEITEAGKEIKSVIEIIRVEQLPHIMLVEMEVVLFILKGITDAVPGQIDARHIEALRCQYTGMAAPATGHIQHAGFPRWIKKGQQAMNKGSRF